MKEALEGGTEISEPFKLPKDSKVGHMLYPIVVNEFKPSPEDHH